MCGQRASSQRLLKYSLVQSNNLFDIIWTPASHLQILFWLQGIFMFIWSIVNYPFSFKFLPEYPFNNLRGHLCSGLGIHSSKTMEKEMTGHLALLFGVPLYRFNIFYLTFKTKRFIKKFTSKGSGASINGLFR